MMYDNFMQFLTTVCKQLVKFDASILKSSQTDLGCFGMIFIIQKHTTDKQ